MPGTDALIGRTLGNYRIERLLGRGGMASVYYGVDVHLERPAAIKVLDERYSDNATYAERFVREARAMASWRHANIPQIYQAGIMDGISYYAMEYVRGLDLDKLLGQVARKGERLSFDDVAVIGRAVAAALDYAHSRGAIHRDVTPANVLISEDQRILLTDFGLVLEVDKGTRGEVFGSPHYIAPEQARNSSRAVPQSDLYSLGVILYQMLVGKLPFDDPSPTALALQHITLEPPNPRQLNPGLSPEIEAVLLKALRKLPEERYQSGKELVDALEQAMHLSRTPAELSQTLSVPPVTLAELPGEKQTPATMSLLQPPATGGVGQAIAQKQTPATLSALEPPIVKPAGTHSGPPTQPKAIPPARAPAVGGNPPRLLPRSSLWIAGLLAAGLLAVLCFAISIPRWLSSASNPKPGVTETQATLPVFFPGSSEPLSTIVPTNTFPVPAQTATQASSTPTRTGTRTPSPSPTTTRTPPTPSRTSTRTPTPTRTPRPTTTPTKETLFHLTIAKYKDDSLFLINKGKVDFPLEWLRFGEKDGRYRLAGEAWEIELLHEGDCVAVWKKEGNPKAPDGIRCELVGKRLERSGAGKFWTSTFKVYFRDVLVGTCKSSEDVCELNFDDPP